MPRTQLWRFIAGEQLHSAHLGKGAARQSQRTPEVSDLTTFSWLLIDRGTRTFTGGNQFGKDADEVAGKGRPAEEAMFPPKNICAFDYTAAIEA
jgi:hypothetical protein